MISLAALALLALAAPDVAAVPEAPPAPGTPRGFTLPAPRRFTLDNGMKVSLVSYGAIPKVLVELAVTGGNAAEGKDEVWLADLTAEMMKQGTTGRTATEVALAAARMGGSLDVSVAQNRTEIAGEVLSEFGPDVVALVAEVARAPRLPASELERVKADLARNLSLARSQAQALAAEAWRARLYPDHAYGRTLPDENALAGYTLAQVQAFHQRALVASRAHLFVVGRFDSATMETAIRTAFSPWQKGTPFDVAVPTPRTGRAVVLIDRPGAVQTSLMVGLPAMAPGDPDFIPLTVANTLLGGYFSSRIVMNIREDKGYTYSPFSQLQGLRHAGFWVEQADVTTPSTGASLQEIFKEIDRLRAEAPPAAELAAVRNYMAGTFVLRNSTRAGIANQLETIDLHGLPDTYLSEYVAKVQAVTPQVVRDMARKYLDPARMAIVAVGDRKVVEEQLKPYQP